jgi:hypothetical protein
VKKPNNIKELIINTKGPVELSVGPRAWLLKCGDGISFGRILLYKGKVLVGMKEGRFHFGRF